VLDGLKSAAPEEVSPQDASAGVLDSLKASAPIPEETSDESGGVLDVLRSAAPEDADEREDSAEALASLQAPPVEASPEEDSSSAVLGALRDAAPHEVEQQDAASAALESLASVALPREVEEDGTDDLLADLAAAAPEEAAGVDVTDDLLADLAAAAPEEGAELDDTDDLLADLATAAPEEGAEVDGTDDLLADLATAAPDAVEEDSSDDLLADLAAAAPEEAVEMDDTDDLLADLAAPAPEEGAELDDTDDLLADLATAAPEEVAEADGTDDLLADLATAAPEEGAEVDGTDDLLADLATAAPEEAAEPDSTDDLLADLAAAAPEAATETDDLDDLLGDLGGIEGIDSPDPGIKAADDLPEFDDVLTEKNFKDTPATPTDDTRPDDLPNDPEAAEDLASPPPSEAADALDDLLGDLDEDLGQDPGATPDDQAAPAPETAPDAAPDSAPDADLDDLLGDLGEDTEERGDGADDLDDLLGDLGGDDAAPAAPEAAANLTGEPEFAYGTLSGDRPAPERLNRKRFRIAILGDFSGRAARGLIETGDALAARRATLLDPDTVEDVIESFSTDLVLPIGKDGAGIAVSLKGLDSLHPDELYENVVLFSELAGLRQQLQSGATAENAARTLRDWAEKHGQRALAPKTRSGGNAVRADLKLSDFQKLIGDTRPKPPEASPAGDLIARIVGPHIRALPDPDATAMTAAVDAALSDAMRMLLHHPEFQSIEAQWRSLDLIARSIEDDDKLDVMLYDISAEEIAADLAGQDDLSQSGFARLLTGEPLDEENGRGGYSALIGLYAFEETPPHAELLGRVGRVAAHVDAPFLAAVAPGFLEIEKKDRHPLVAKAWDTLRAMPEAGHLGLVTPRFMLRRPYGAKTEPIYEFEFEEFTLAEGLSGLLWANPAVLAAILLARSFRKNGPSLGLGSVMSLGEMPYHYVTDRYGDQVALPCTERNLTQSRVEFVMARGFMPVVSIKGRDEVRLASFQSLAGGDILGPWSGTAPPQPSPPNPAPPPAAGGEAEAGNVDLDDLLSGFGDDAESGGDGGDDGDIEADLAALLDDL
ncbi:MAG: type VI secretion system contractile sheath large subunit, partial [Antarcticimicrobium sp.]|uniref:type VI secretion system contractile sheath domain-containing protein n=1 Tax=Antarcticimicrobium sp. TaxID=2824147 RepID=UPI00260D8022